MSVQEIQSLRSDVNAIQIQLEKDHGAWYSKPSNVIAFAALIFSFGTTLVSSLNAHQQDVRENRAEARQLIQRLSKLPIENFELMDKYKQRGDGQRLSSMINQENIVLAVQAAELIDRFPDSFSSSELQAVAAALASSNIGHRVPELYEKAILRANTANDYQVASRSLGSFLYLKGNVLEGDRYFQMSLDVWDLFPESNEYFKKSSDFQTLFFWSSSALGIGNTAKATELAARANGVVGELPPGPFTDSLKMQMVELERMIDMVTLDAAAG